MNIKSINKLNQMIADDLILRFCWTGKDDQGRETVCLLAALSPEVAEKKTAKACPASLMPAWLAHLTVWMDDSVSNAYWPKMLKEYAWMISKIHLLSEEKLNQLDYECRLIAINKIRFHIPKDEFQTLKMIDEILISLKKSSKGEKVFEEELTKIKTASFPLGAVGKLFFPKYTHLYGAEESTDPAIIAASLVSEAAVGIGIISKKIASAQVKAEKKASDEITKKILAAFRREIELVF